MPREKKDGRFINFYVERSIFERLKKYADSKDLTMTRALERLLEKALNAEESTVRKEE